ncbi:MAG: redoxin domain-containing protein [Fimbriimonadaceae bacterium]
MMPLQVDSVAPAFTAIQLGSEGPVTFDLADRIGKVNIVLLFFPAAFTGVCTQELCQASRPEGALNGADLEVYGLSADTAFAQQAWAQQENISIPLLSDRTLQAANAYDVVLPDLVGMGPAAARAAFVIDKEGIIRYAEQTPTPLDLPNFAQIQQAIDSLK